MPRILVVDDEADMREMLSQMLQRAGHQVLTACNGAEALEVHQRHQPDLTIMDIVMPEKGGLVAIAEIRKRSPETKIIAMSGGGRSGKLNFLSTARSFPGVATVRKPFRREQLLGLVEEVLGDPAD